MRKLDPSELFELNPDRPELAAPVLVQALDGFIDAGGAKRLAREHLLGSFESQVVATFDVDQLLDYRARRPAMLFVEDHWESYADPQLAVHLLHDAAGTGFLVLTGPEPDVQWERFTEAVRMVVERLGVRLTIGLNAIPMGVPHTRPTGVIAHGSRKELVAGYEPWVNAVQVPGTAGHLIEYRLGSAGYDAMGFAVHVPHYVSQAEYPAAAAALLAEVAKAGGLVLPLDALQEAAATTRAAIDEQVADAPEVAAVVAALENQYDAFLAGRESSLLLEHHDLPTADELGAELERFLAEQSRQDPPA
jgi:predicted ATP-grasp superfamily ATP-dependent carboligase